MAAYAGATVAGLGSVGAGRRRALETNTTVVPVRVSDDLTIQVEAVTGGGEQDISAGDFAFETATQAIEQIATLLARTLDRVKPKKATIEFELDFSVESGQLTALFVKGSGSGTLKISLEWETP
jgi:hypothetical protein